MVLHAERGTIGKLEPGKAAVEQRDVRRPGIGRQRLGLDREAVIHAGDLDPAVVEPLDRMVGAAMPLVHLGRPAAAGSTATRAPAAARLRKMSRLEPKSSATTCGRLSSSGVSA